MDIKNRNEIPVEFTWDLTKMIKDENEFNELEKNILNLCDKLISYKGKITSNEQNLYQFLKKYDELDNKLTKFYIYAHMLCDTDTNNSNYQSLKLKTEKLNETISSKLSFIKSELLSNDYQYILSLIDKNKLLEEYRFDLEKTFSYKKYTLSDKEEELITKLTNAFGTPYSVSYNIINADILLGSIKDKDGNDILLDNSNYIKLMTSNDEILRKNAFTNMYTYYKNLKNTIATTYNGKIKEDNTISNIRGFKSYLEQSLFNDKVSVDVYKNLINKVHNNLDKMYEYMKLKKEALKLDELHMYDIYLTIGNKSNIEIPFDKGKELVINALNPLGEDYISILKKSLKERWIDIYPNNYKRSGAYSWGTYGTIPYLLLNYDNTINSVSTMIHELGHSMHSYYSFNNQNYVYHQYPIILAEIASTVNEILLNEYLYNNSSTKEEKITYLSELLEKIRTTIFRQTMFAEFEMLMHDKEANNIPITEKLLSDTYYDLNKLYYGNNVISDELIRYEWMRIPHFYTPFYVYKYATGLSIAIKIAYDIINNKNNRLEKYLQFLKSGCSKYPLELLKDMDIDLEQGFVIDDALNLFEIKLEELKKLLNS